MPRYPVVVAVGVEDAFRKTSRKNPQRAETIWRALLRQATALADDPLGGIQIPKDRFPEAFADAPNLWKLDLPSAHRAIYTVAGRPGDRAIIAILWVGSHRRYERLFGHGDG